MNKEIHYVFVVIKLPVADHHQVRKLVQLHGLHSVRAIDDCKPMETDAGILKRNLQSRHPVSNSRDLTLILLSFSILQASGPRCVIFENEHPQCFVKLLGEAPKIAQMPHMLPQCDSLQDYTVVSLQC